MLRKADFARSMRAKGLGMSGRKRLAAAALGVFDGLDFLIGIGVGGEPVLAAPVGMAEYFAHNFIF